MNHNQQVDRLVSSLAVLNQQLLEFIIAATKRNFVKGLPLEAYEMDYSVMPILLQNQKVIQFKIGKLLFFQHSEQALKQKFRSQMGRVLRKLYQGLQADKFKTVVSTLRDLQSELLQRMKQTNPLTVQMQRVSSLLKQRLAVGCQALLGQQPTMMLNSVASKKQRIYFFDNRIIRESIGATHSWRRLRLYSSKPTLPSRAEKEKLQAAKLKVFQPEFEEDDRPTATRKCKIRTWIPIRREEAKGSQQQWPEEQSRQRVKQKYLQRIYKANKKKRLGSWFSAKLAKQNQRGKHNFIIYNEVANNSKGWSLQRRHSHHA